MTMLKSCKVFFSMILFAGLLISCNKDDITDLGGKEQSENLNTNTTGSDRDGEKDGDSDHEFELDECFDFVYPITVIFPDQSQVQATDANSLEAEVEQWYTDNLNSTTEPTLVYPVDVVLDDNSQQTINSDQELTALLETCEDDESHCDDFNEDCFEVQFPLTFTLPDGSQHTANDEAAAELIIDAYYEANPNDERDPMLVFPVTIIFEDGTTEVIDSEEALEAAEDNCEDHDDEDGEFEEDCFTLQFPLTFTLPDGSQHTANDEAAAELIIDAYYEANPNDERDPMLVFPVTIIFEDGTTEVIDSEEVFEAAEDNCEDHDDEDGEFEEDCFALQFPLTFILPDGTQHTSADEHAAEAIVEAYFHANPNDDEDDIELVYPVTIILEDGTTQAITTERELEDAEDLCED